MERAKPPISLRLAAAALLLSGFFLLAVSCLLIWVVARPEMAIVTGRWKLYAFGLILASGSVFIMYGATQIWTARRYRLAVAAAVSGMLIPILFTFAPDDGDSNPVMFVVLAVPGLWSLAMLLNPEVRQMFALPQPAGQIVEQSKPPEWRPAGELLRTRLAELEQQANAARQAADRLRARGALSDETAEALTKMEGYLEGAAKSIDRQDWVKAKGFADWAEYEAGRVLTSAG